MYTYCRHHPSQVISNGMFDAPCGGCEHEMSEADVTTEDLMLVICDALISAEIVHVSPSFRADGEVCF